MPRAHGITVFRGGATASSVERAREAWPSLHPDWYFANGRQVRGAVISFAINSKGGGKTELRVFIEPSQFADLASAMVNVDARAARAAFKSALVKNKVASGTGA